MNAAELQQALFRQVKESLPPHLSLAEELAALLGVSTDSAYRRIRGEKPLDLGELAVITRKFRLSVDGLIGQHAGGFLFQGPFVDGKEFTFTAWLNSLNRHLEEAASGKDTTFIFQSKDIPLFHHFSSPELSIFKFFFWRKTILQEDSPDLQALDLSIRDEALLALGKKTYLTYCRMPSVEIWNAEGMSSTLRQISYYRATGVFRKEEDAQLLFDCCVDLLGHLELQAEHGLKFLPGDRPEEGTARYQLFHNEVLLGDNAIYIDNGQRRIVFLNHTGVHYLGTTDARFVEHTKRSLENIMRRSTPISGSGEKERKRFFNALRADIEVRRR